MRGWPPSRTGLADASALGSAAAPAWNPCMNRSWVQIQTETRTRVRVAQKCGSGGQA